MKIDFKKGKEYNIYYTEFPELSMPTWEYNLTFIKATVVEKTDSTKDDDPEYLYHFTTLFGRYAVYFGDSIHVWSEPVTATDMFKMHTNYMNFYREGVHQDLEYADKLRHEITNTLHERRHVMFGAGKFEEYDYRLMYKLDLRQTSSLYRYDVGCEYELQNGERVTVLARYPYYAMFKYIYCSDGVWRYDFDYEDGLGVVFGLRSGMISGGARDYIDGKNILNHELGNCYVLNTKQYDD